MHSLDEMDPDRVNHLDLLREVVAISTKVDRLIQDQQDHRRSMDGDSGVYARLNRLEQAKAQVLILAVMSSLVLPVIVTVGIERIWPAPHPVMPDIKASNRLIP